MSQVDITRVGSVTDWLTLPIPAGWIGIKPNDQPKEDHTPAGQSGQSIARWISHFHDTILIGVDEDNPGANNAGVTYFFSSHAYGPGLGSRRAHAGAIVKPHTVGIGGLVSLLRVLFGMVILATSAAAAERWIHPACAPLEAVKNGPFVQRKDGTLLMIDGNRPRTSTDDGTGWSTPGPPIAPGMEIGRAGHVGQLLLTQEGTLIVLYLDFNGYKFSWDNDKGAPNPDCRLELWAIRSPDGGQTWVDRQRLLEGYNADFMGLIQTRTGQVVATCEHLAPELKRWLACSFVSTDEGKSWQRSNWIDLGGHGHHDGATEPMVAELADGRLLMLLRTSLDQFWKAYSTDQGRYWRVIQPSGVDASSAPGWLARLRSGRLVLAWNRFKPEGKTEWRRSNWAGPAFEFPASMHREELSIAFSNDDGQTWSDPVVLAREPGGQLSYPYILERRPGYLWVFTRYTFDAGGKPAPPVAVGIREADFVTKP